jgi:hypothetical protein
MLCQLWRVKCGHAEGRNGHQAGEWPKTDLGARNVAKQTQCLGWNRPVAPFVPKLIARSTLTDTQADRVVLDLVRVRL